MKTFSHFSLGAITSLAFFCLTIATFAHEPKNLALRKHDSFIGLQASLQTNDSSSSVQPTSISIEQSKKCSTDLATLTTQLLQDIPNYGNRVIQRTQDKHQQANIQTYIVTAGQPEFEPLNLPQIKYTGAKDNQPQQIFFTTLEKQYTNNQKIERETYHWLFVTLADSGWYLVTMFSRFGNATKNTPPTPPQESSNGIIGQAVNLWLRDCRADALH